MGHVACSMHSTDGKCILNSSQEPSRDSHVGGIEVDEMILLK